jgi:hypothetical protein
MNRILTALTATTLALGIALVGAPALGHDGGVSTLSSIGSGCCKQ